MHVELTSDQRDLVLQLVDAALRDIGPEIRHTTSREYKDDLRDHRRSLQDLHTLLSIRPMTAPPTDYVGTT